MPRSPESISRGWPVPVPPISTAPRKTRAMQRDVNELSGADKRLLTAIADVLGDALDGIDAAEPGLGHVLHGVAADIRFARDSLIKRVLAAATVTRNPLAFSLRVKPKKENDP